ncbi:MAG TPA: helix-turn-helix domain-containing protein [Acidimicrobiales bacterium]|jgi:AcrR family transcriptional regulator
MSSSAAVPSLSHEPPRRRLSTRQAETVHKLTLAAVEELRAEGFEGLTVRNVARRAGVAPATAYTYFTSKEHLVSEVFWRRLQALPETHQHEQRSVTGRVDATLRDLALLVADEPELAAACTVAMLATDPDVKALRDRIGTEMHRRIALALGPDASPAVLLTLDLVLSGSLLQAGTGHIAYADLPALLADVVALVVEPPR